MTLPLARASRTQPQPPSRVTRTQPQPPSRNGRNGHGTGDATALVELWNCLEAESPSVRGEALRALANLGAQNVIGACVDRLRESTDEYERLLAIAALDARDEAGFHLRNCWQDSSLTNRERMMLGMLLAKRKTLGVQPFLEKELKRCEEETTALGLAAALAHFGNKSGLSLIRRKLAGSLSDSAKSILRSLTNDLQIPVDASKSWEEHLSSWVEEQLQSHD